MHATAGANKSRATAIPSRKPAIAEAVVHVTVITVSCRLATASGFGEMEWHCNLSRFRKGRDSILARLLISWQKVKTRETLSVRGPLSCAFLRGMSRAGDNTRNPSTEEAAAGRCDCAFVNRSCARMLISYAERKCTCARGGIDVPHSTGVS